MIAVILKIPMMRIVLITTLIMNIVDMKEVAMVTMIPNLCLNMSIEAKPTQSTTAGMLENKTTR